MLPPPAEPPLPPPVPTLAERINALAALAVTGTAAIDGDTSPRAAARQAIETFRQSVIKFIAEAP